MTSTEGPPGSIVPREFTRAAMAAAATEAEAQGGGTVFLPAGTYVAEPLTVSQIITYLSSLPPDLPVRALYDAECAAGNVTEVRRRAMAIDSTEAEADSAVLVIN
jgi:hypothetical protein